MAEAYQAVEMEEIEVENQEDRELGSKSIKTLFIKYSALTLAGMLAQAIMVIFEGIIIGRGLGAEGLAVVGLIMPMEYLMLALGGFFAIGISTVAATRLGNNDKEGARKAYAQGMWFSIYFMAALSLAIAIFAPTVARFIGTPDEFLPQVTMFIRIFMVGYPFCIIGHNVVFIARVDEKPSIATYALTGSAIAALAWLYVSVFILKLGIVGAAGYYASSIGLWAVFALYFIFSKKTIFKIHAKDMALSKELIVEIIKIGAPYLVVQGAIIVYTIVVNTMLGKFGTSLDIAAFAVINSYIIYILMMIAQSATQGMQPIASYNLGAHKLGRVSELVKVSISGNIIGVYAVAIIFMVFAKGICGLFVGDEIELLEMSVRYTRMIAAFSALGFTANLMSGYFQAVGRLKASTILGICRYIIFAIPFTYILAGIMGINGVWYAQPVADILAFALTLVFAGNELKRLKAMRKNQKTEGVPAFKEEA